MSPVDARLLSSWTFFLNFPMVLVWLSAWYKACLSGTSRREKAEKDAGVNKSSYVLSMGALQSIYLDILCEYFECKLLTLRALDKRAFMKCNSYNFWFCSWYGECVNELGVGSCKLVESLPVYALPFTCLNNEDDTVRFTCIIILY